MFVGRKKEYAVLTDHLHDALNGRGNIVFISGEAGLGKTTLVEHWWRDVSKDFEKNNQWNLPLFAKSSCSVPIGGVNVGELEALQPFSDIMSTMYSSAASDKSKGKKVSEVIMDVAPDWLEAIPVVGKLASAGMKTFSTFKKGKEEAKEKPISAQSQNQVFQQFSEFLFKTAETMGSVVLWIDDMHWADRSSLNLLFYLSRELKANPVLIIVSYRPEDIGNADDEKESLLKIRNEMLRYESGTVIDLGFLSESDISLFLSKAIDLYKVNEKFEKWLLKTSGGNSLFVSQYVKTLMEDGLINTEGIVSDKYELLGLPGTVNAVIEERIRRLEPDLADLLRYATAEGEEFTTYIVSRLTSKPPLEVIKALKTAEAMGIIRNSGNGKVYSKEKTTIYVFNHALFYKSLYDSLSEEEKMILHRQCFEVLVDEWEKNPKNLMLSTKTMAHAERSEEFYSAAKIGLKAAITLKGNYSTIESYEILEKIISVYAPSLEEADPELYENDFVPNILIEAVVNKGYLNNRISRFSEAVSAFRKAIDLNSKGVNIKLKIDALNGASHNLFVLENYGEAAQMAEEALKLSQEINFSFGINNSLYNLGQIRQGSRDYAEANSYYEEGLSNSKNISDKYSEMFFLYKIGQTLLELGKPDEAEIKFLDTKRLAEGINDLHTMASSELHLAKILNTRGKYTEAIDNLHKAQEFFEKIKTEYNKGSVYRDLAFSYAGLGNYPEAIRYSELSVELFTRLERNSQTILSLQQLSRVYKEMNMLDKCEEVLREAVKLTEDSVKLDIRAATLGELGLLEEKKGNTELACKYLEDCIALLMPKQPKEASEWGKELTRIKALK